MSTTIDEPRSAGLHRRTLVRGAAWTVPVVAVAAAAPAYAASCTQQYEGTLNWASAANYTRTSATSATGSFTAANGVVVGVTLTSLFTGYTDSTTNTDNTPNLGVTPVVGGTGGSGLTLTQTANANANVNIPNNRQRLTIAFNKPVYNLKFTFTDIDSGTGQYNDAVAIGNTTFAASAVQPAGSTVVGTGTMGTTAGTGDPYTQNGPNNTAENVNGTNGNKAITIAGPVTSFYVYYWNRITSNNIGANGTKQTIFISNLVGSVLNANC